MDADSRKVLFFTEKDMIRILVFTFFYLFLNIQLVIAIALETDWKTHKICTKDSQKLISYCLELKELQTAGNKNFQNVVLFLPGIFQNANSYDLLPEKGISLARYIEEKFNVKVYVLNPRGSGESDYVKGTIIDDLAIDDISVAVAAILKEERKRPYIVGHSQGAIALQAWAAGISRCGIKKNCFLKTVAGLRGLSVKGLGLIAGNAAMTLDSEKNFLVPLSAIGRTWAMRNLLVRLDLIEVTEIIKRFGLIPFLKIWENIYNVDNVSEEARIALWNRAISSAPGASLVQYADAIKNKNITTQGGDTYSSGLKNITPKLYQIVMQQDPLAPPIATRATFEHIGSKEKRFEVIDNRGHTDFQLSEKLHSDIDQMFKFLVGN